MNIKSQSVQPFPVEPSLIPILRDLIDEPVKSLSDKELWHMFCLLIVGIPMEEITAFMAKKYGLYMRKMTAGAIYKGCQQIKKSDVFAEYKGAPGKLYKQSEPEPEPGSERLSEPERLPEPVAQQSRQTIDKPERRRDGRFNPLAEQIVLVDTLWNEFNLSRKLVQGGLIQLADYTAKMARLLRDSISDVRETCKDLQIDNTAEYLRHLEPDQARVIQNVLVLSVELDGNNGQNLQGLLTDFASKLPNLSEPIPITARDMTDARIDGLETEGSSGDSKRTPAADDRERAGESSVNATGIDLFGLDSD